jgi:hypothetical protein
MLHAAPLPLLLGLLIGSGDAPDASPSPPPASLSGAARIGTSADVPRGDGPGFEVAFQPHGPVFQPIYGAGAPDAPWLGLELESIARGGHVVAAGGAVQPEVLGSSGDPVAVLYPRGPRGPRGPRRAVSELYEPRGAGFEQSFVVSERPAGGGDLVVRLRLTGPLAAAPARADGDGLAFERADVAHLGGVRVGGVTGVGADGATAPGSLRRDGAHLELVLPAAFVDAARYPLVVDPLIGGTIDVDTSTNEDRVRDVAYDRTWDNYLVVFERVVSASDVRICARRVSGAGTAVGGTIFLSSTDVASHPRVANVDASSRFAVVWSEETSGFFGFGRVRLQSVDPSFGFPGTVVTVATDVSGDLHSPDVAGQGPATLDAAALVTWVRADEGIQTARVLVPPSASPTVQGETTVAFHPVLGSVAAPALSRTTLLENQLLLVYQLNGLLGTDVRAMLLDHAGQVVFPPITVSTSDKTEIEPEVDGDGRNFVVAWSVEKETTTLYNDVRAARVYVTSSGLVAESSVLLDPAPFATQRNPRVAYGLGKAFVAYAYNLAGMVPRAAGVDPFTLGVCEDPFSLTVPQSIDAADLAIASVSSGGVVSDDRALLAYSASTLLGGPNVYGQLVDATGPGGAVTDLGGGCGLGGTNSTAGPVAIGNGQLSFQLAGADPSATLALFNLALSPPAPLVCGPCAWTPFQFTFVQNASGGGSSHAVWIPCDTALVGAVLEAQWTVPSPSATPCGTFAGFSLSNRLRMTIGK